MGFSFFTDLITPTSYKVPDAPTVDLDAEQLAGARSNYASFSESKKLATDFNAFMRQEFDKALASSVPEFEGLQRQMAANLGSKLKGEIPQDVADQVMRKASSRALGLGIAGSPSGDAIGLRDLGLTSLQIQSDAESRTPGYLSAIAGIKRAPQFDFANVFLSPAQRMVLQFKNKEAEFSVQNLKNQMKAQPEPWMKALAGLGDDVVNAVAAYYTMGGSTLAGGGDKGAGGGIPAANTSRMFQEFYGGI